MRILHIAAPGEVGGLESVVQLLASGQQRRGHEVHLAAVLGESSDADANHPLLSRLVAAGVDVHTIRVSGRGYLEERRRVADLCRRIEPSVVHTHGYRPDVVDAGVARRLKIPTVTTVHGFTGGDRKNRLYEVLQRRAFRRFSAVVAVSRPMADQLERAGVPKARLHILQNAWGGSEPSSREEARAKLSLNGSGRHIGWVGRLSHEKGADVMVAALALLADLPVTLSILGDGRERSSLEAQAGAAGIRDRIRWQGTVPGAGSLFRAFDTFVISSRTEGTPIALFEAMAAGTPVVTTRVGGVPHVVSPDEAILVAPEDPAALAAGIRQALLDKPASDRRAASAKQRLTRDFGVEPWLDAYDSIYERAGSATRSRAS